LIDLAHTIDLAIELAHKIDTAIDLAHKIDTAIDLAHKIDLAHLTWGDKRAVDGRLDRVARVLQPYSRLLVDSNPK